MEMCIDIYVIFCAGLVLSFIVNALITVLIGL